ncbi:DUF4870 domain-containing protein [Metabacillus iocasae]|uniref:DUF4870 domain-containing protein n=1 Tax=Priestia iocasae TaxID=2291674 RepID=A0ABS2QZQ6_9BACI|nr:DUF4870 domain-containing protein [Metabacillus iocasae]MBM7704497.1 hypothetical protein [Metabacillus iocasae]
MEPQKFIASLCYFSVFFAPFLVPIVIYFITDEREVKDHAKAALFSHLLPIILIPLFFVILLPSLHVSEGFALIWIFLSVGVSFLLSAGIVVWNVVKGIRVLGS